MNPFKFKSERKADDTEDPDPDAGTKDGSKEDSKDELRPTIREVEDLLETTDESTVVLQSDHSDDYLDLDTRLSVDEPDDTGSDSSVIGLGERIEITNERLGSIRTGLKALTESRSRSDEILGGVSRIDSRASRQEPIREAIQSAETSVQDFRITLGRVKPSYPSFIATDMATSIDESQQIAQSLENVTEQ